MMEPATVIHDVQHAAAKAAWAVAALQHQAGACGPGLRCNASVSTELVLHHTTGPYGQGGYLEAADASL